MSWLFYYCRFIGTTQNLTSRFVSLRRRWTDQGTDSKSVAPLYLRNSHFIILPFHPQCQAYHHQIVRDLLVTMEFSSKNQSASYKTAQILPEIERRSGPLVQPYKTKWETNEDLKWTILLMTYTEYQHVAYLDCQRRIGELETGYIKPGTWMLLFGASVVLSILSSIV